MTHNPKDLAPWYRQSIFWILMTGPIIVVFAALYTFYIAQSNADDLVSDDYYKDGKHINLALERDEQAANRHIQAQVLLNPEKTAAKIFLSGDIQENAALNLLFIHPAKKAFDQTIPIQMIQAAPSGKQIEYAAQFNALPEAVHWYVRLEDTAGNWRVETKWLPSQGLAMELKPNENVLKLKQTNNGNITNKEK